MSNNVSELKKSSLHRLSLTSLREKAIERIESASEFQQKSLSRENTMKSMDKICRDKRSPDASSIKSHDNNDSSDPALSPDSPNSPLKENERLILSEDVDDFHVVETVDHDIKDFNVDTKDSQNVSTSSTVLTTLTSSRPKLSSRKSPTKNPARELAKLETPTQPENSRKSDVPKQEISEDDVSRNDQSPIKEKTPVGIKLPGLNGPGFASGFPKLRKQEEPQQRVSENGVSSIAPTNEVDAIRSRLRSVQGAAKEEIKQFAEQTSSTQQTETITKTVTSNTVTVKDIEKHTESSPSVSRASSQADLLKKLSTKLGKSNETLQAEETLQGVRGKLKSVQASSRDNLAFEVKKDFQPGQQSNVPEFLLFRNKLRSVKIGSKEDLERKDANSSLPPSKNDQYGSGNRLSMINSPFTLKPEQSSSYTSPLSPTAKYSYSKTVPSSPTKTVSASSGNLSTSRFASGSSSSTQISLRNLKNDPFVNAAGGAVRPNIPLMWMIKGKRKLFAHRVPISLSTLNQADCFILDIPPNTKSNDPEKQISRPLFVCSGSNSSKIRRTKTIEIANLMKDFDYSGKADIFLLELGNIKSRMIVDEEFKFWQQILQSDNIPSRFSIGENVEGISKFGTDDAEFDTQMDSELKITFFDTNGNQTSERGAKELKRAKLSSDICAVIECAREIYVWAGKSSSETTRNAVMAYAEKNKSDKFLFLEGEKFERVSFKMKFEDWQPGKELSIYNVLEVKQASNIKPKDKEWKVYDRGADTKKVDQIDIVRMYDKNSAPENMIAKNSESMEMDPAELIRRDWGFINMRVWAIHDKSGSSDKNAKVALTAENLETMEVKFSAEKPFVMYSQDCYIILYEYREKPPKMNDSVLVERSKITKEELESSMKEHSVIYLWSGSESSVSDQGVTAHAALEIEKNTKTTAGLSIKAKHVRVFEGKENTHFLNMIRGGRIPRDQPKKIQALLSINSNPPASVVAYRRGSRETRSDDTIFYHVSGGTDETVRITQMSNPSVELICSGSVYVLLHNNSCTVWNGKGSFSWERDAAKSFVDKILRVENSKLSVKFVDEGQEQKDFWTSLGGQKIGSNEEFWKKRPLLPVEWPEASLSLGSTQSEGQRAPYDVRLWKINHFINGNPTALEIFPFTQNDLEDDSVCVMDAYFKIYVWIGAVTARNRTLQEDELEESSVLKKFAFERQTAKSAAAEFKDLRLALDTVIRYVDYISERENGRLSHQDCLVIQAGQEPPIFKCQFPNWKPRKVMNEIQWPSNIDIDESMDYFERKKYSVDTLRNLAKTRTDLPFGLDLEHLEKYLNEKDFESIFGMEMIKFQSQPTWKQIDMKRKFGLF